MTPPRPDAPPMNHDLVFTLTHGDLVHALEAEHTERTGMRRWARGAAIALGTMWGIAATVVVVSGTPRPGAPAWLPAVWMALAAAILWFLVVRPVRERRALLAASPEEEAVALAFRDEGFELSSDGTVARYAWDHALAVLDARRGVLLRFVDGGTRWIPERAFRDRAQRAGFVAEVLTRLDAVAAEEESAMAGAGG